MNHHVSFLFETLNILYIHVYKGVSDAIYISKKIDYVCVSLLINTCE